MRHDMFASATRHTAAATDAQLVSGLRWTLWLSVLTAPCGYFTSILLARVGPEAIGEYGLLSLYVAITSVFVFLGGPAVAIRFIPTLPPECRLPFLWSYLVVACAAALPFQLVSAIWPGTLQYVFGEVGTPRFHILLMWLADFYILFNLLIAGLKALMELKLAQLLVRAVTVGSFVIYASLCVWLPRVMAAHHHIVIWSVYFGVTGIVTAVALRTVVVRSSASPGRWLWMLPDGFWRYTLGLQASSVLGFLSTKLDYLFILNAGGLLTLGRYVALMTLLSVVPLFATFVLDSYLPSLTNLLSTGNTARSEQLTRTYVRLILLLGCGSISFMSIFADPLVRLLGPGYAELTGMLRVALPFAGVQITNWIIGTIFSGVGHPQRDAVAKGFRGILFVLLFWPLWNSAQFLGAVWAWGIAEVGYQIVSLYLLRNAARFRLSLYGAYIPMLVLSIGLKYVAGSFGDPAFMRGLALWFASMGSFVLMAHYNLSEFRMFWRALWPGSRSGDAEIFASPVKVPQAT